MFGSTKATLLAVASLIGVGWGGGRAAAGRASNRNAIATAVADTVNRSWTLGSRVHAVNAGDASVAAVFDRADSTAASTVLASIPLGTKGTLRGGPFLASDGGQRWKVAWDGFPLGWSRQLYLAMDSLAGPVVTRVTVSLAQVALFATQTVTLGASLQDANGATLAGSVTWTSSANTVATVSSSGSNSGLVTALAPGTATITARSLNGVSGSCVVTVTLVPIRTLTITPALDTLLIGEGVQLIATTLDSAGHILTGRPITWSTPTPTIVSISPTGLVGALAAGFGQATATSGVLSATSALIVRASGVATLTISPIALSVNIGQPAVHLFVVARDATGQVVAAPITWINSNSTASLDPLGNVLGLSVGVDTILAQTGTLTARAIVTVLPALPPPVPLPVGCGIAIPPPVGCGMRAGTWALLGIDTVSKTYGPWFIDDTLGQKHKAVRVVVTDTTP